MESFIQKTIAKIMAAKTTEQLYKIKSGLSTKPFCGIEKCYSLETFVFKVVSQSDKEKILKHIANISGEGFGTRPHIFISGDYFNKLDKTQKCFLEDNVDFITIIGEDNPVMYYAKNSKTNIDYINQKLIQGDKVQIETNAQLIYQTIWNYKKLFPSFMPIWIGELSSENIAIVNRLSSMDDYMGALLHTTLKQKDTSNYKVFRDNVDFIKKLNSLLRI